MHKNTFFPSFSPSNKPGCALCKIICIILFILLVGALAFGYFFYKDVYLTKCTTTNCGTPEQKASKEAAKNETTTAQGQNQWKSSQILTYSLEHPLGWHVSDKWAAKPEDPFFVFADPNPISTAPRGGPIAEVSITIYDGPKDVAATVLARERKKIREAFDTVTETVLPGNYGKPVYKYAGKMSIYGQTYDSEMYVLEITGPASYPGGVAVVDRNPFNTTYSNVAQHIAETFKFSQR